MEIEKEKASQFIKQEDGLAWLQVLEDFQKYKETHELCLFLQDIKAYVKRLKEEFPLNNDYLNNTGFCIYVPQTSVDENDNVLTADDKRNILLKCAAHYEGSLKN